MPYSSKKSTQSSQSSRRIAELPVSLARVCRNAPTSGVAERAADIQIALVSRIAGDSRAHIHREGFRRLYGAENDGAGQRIAAIERALRALQHFDLRDVAQLLVERIGVRLQHPVDDQREIGLGVAARVDAANHDLQVAGFGRLHLRNAGRHRDEVGRPVDAGRADIRSREHLDRSRHVHQFFGTLPGGDHDFLQCALVGRCRTFLRPRNSREEQRDRCGKDQSQRCAMVHGSILIGMGYHDCHPVARTLAAPARSICLKETCAAWMCERITAAAQLPSRASSALTISRWWDALRTSSVSS